MDWYKFDIAAYQRATEGLSAIEDGIYRRMIDACYQREGPLPSDLGTIYRLTHALTKHEKAAVRTVLQRFWVALNGHYHNTRCDAELLQYQGLCDAARKAAGIRWAYRSASDPQCREIDRKIQPPLPPTSTPVDNSCQHHNEDGTTCGKPGTHKLHPRSTKWYCSEHLDG